MRTILTTLFLLSFSTNAISQNHFFDTTLKVNKQTFHIVTKDLDSDFVLLSCAYNLMTALNDTIDGGGLSDVEFPDFNKDGYPDIMLTYMGNNSTYFLYLFDQMTNRFKSIDGFDKYPEAIQLKANSKYYYSYHRAGCADMNWVSDLFKIVNFKTIQVGHIYGQGCDFEVKQNPQVIEIYKVTNDDEEKGKLISKLPYLKFIPDFGDKWDFIRKYWNKNYKQFE